MHYRTAGREANGKLSVPSIRPTALLSRWPGRRKTRGVMAENKRMVRNAKRDM